MPSHPACGIPILQNVLLVDRLEFAEDSHSFETTSLPGHLLHMVLTGSVVQQVSGREYRLQPGHLFWYHESELVRGEVTQAPWMFYTVNYTAPTLPPPSFERRVAVAGLETAEKFAILLDAWKDCSSPRIVRDFSVQARMLTLLADVWPRFGISDRLAPESSLWWELETGIRRDIADPPDLARLRQISGASNSTIIRSCLSAVGTTPMRRVKQIRLSLARGLVLRSVLPLSEIANLVGYDRVHEFSRDYKKRFGAAPSFDRRAFARSG